MEENKVKAFSKNKKKYSPTDNKKPAETLLSLSH